MLTCHWSPLDSLHKESVVQKFDIFIAQLSIRYIFIKTISPKTWGANADAKFVHDFAQTNLRSAWLGKPQAQRIKSYVSFSECVCFTLVPMKSAAQSNEIIDT